MWIDTHCHLTDEYTDDIAGVIARAAAANVKSLICPGADPKDMPRVIEIANKYDNVFCTIGIHPEYAGQVVDFNFQISDKTVGIGEIGLDYHYGSDSRTAQIELFERQLEIAKRHNLPVAIHTRDAEEDTKSILDGSVRGVMHCYTSSWDLAKTMLDRGFFFSASGILTFKNADELRAIFSKIPTDRIVIETDSPYCAPIPFRGKTCEPAMVVEVAKVLADIKNLQLDELEIILEQNTKRLYPKLITNTNHGHEHDAQHN